MNATMTNNASPMGFTAEQSSCRFDHGACAAVRAIGQEGGKIQRSFDKSLM